MTEDIFRTAQPNWGSEGKKMWTEKYEIHIFKDFSAQREKSLG